MNYTSDEILNYLTYKLLYKLKYNNICEYSNIMCD